MTPARILAAASLALAATVATSSLAFAAPAAAHAQAATPTGAGRAAAPVADGHAPAARPAGRDEGASPFRSNVGDWGFAPRQSWRGRKPGGWHDGGRRYRSVYPFGYPFVAGGLYDGYWGYGPGPFGPEPPYGDSFDGPPPPFARPMAPALAPLAYGRGTHDGAYAYGYNGYAQTPALPVQYGALSWPGVLVNRTCGC